MPRINLSRRSQPALGDMRHLVWIATTVERPDPDGPSSLVDRPGVFRTHARIVNMRPDIILNYQSVFGLQNTPTIEITIRNPPDVKIDLNHWVYRPAPPTQIWYKVRNVEDLGNVGRFLVLGCSIDEVNDARSDPATQQSPPRWDAPEPPLSQVIDRI